MGDVEAAMRAAHEFEQHRQDAHSPVGGGDPGVTLAGGDLSALGMSADAVVPVHGDLEQAEDYRS